MNGFEYHASLLVAKQLQLGVNLRVEDNTFLCRCFHKSCVLGYCGKIISSVFYLVVILK